ncbi:MAG TPA: hypothetical protein VIY48_10605 [Candidatus Paceibacterota bacterium]
MTAICGGGTSQPKFGTAAVVEYNAGLLAAIFAAYDIAWLIPIIPLVGLAPLVLTTFCGSDPPALPVFTDAEVNAVLNLQFSSASFGSGLNKVKDLALRLAWFDSCQCNAPPQPTFTPPAIPPTTPISTVPNPPALADCQTFTSGVSPLFNGGSFAMGGPTNLRTLGAQAVLFTFTEVIRIAPGCGVRWDINFEQTFPSFLAIGSTTFTAPASGVFNTVYPIIAGSDDINVHATGVSGTGDTDVSFVATVLCPNSQVTAPLECCPPDPALMALVNAIKLQVDLLQRQLAPFAYVPGTAHAGLTGTGELVVQGLLGVKIEYTVPNRASIVLGDPSAIYDIGWVAFGTADGWSPRQWISHAPFLWTPADASLATKLGYTLMPGVTATITELVREP